MSTLIIVGAGGHGMVVADAALKMGAWTDVKFYDDHFPSIKDCYGFDVLGTFSDLKKVVTHCDGIVVAIGDNQVRLKMTEELMLAGGRVVNVVHPSAVVSEFTEVEAGTVVLAGAVISPHSRIGRASIINTASVIEHDCELCEGVHVSPGVTLCGGVTVGRMSWLGAGSSVKNNTAIGSHSIIGLGAAVITDIPPNSTYVGNPAKAIFTGSPK